MTHVRGYRRHTRHGMVSVRPHSRKTKRKSRGHWMGEGHGRGDWGDWKEEKHGRHMRHGECKDKKNYMG